MRDRLAAAPHEYDLVVVGGGINGAGVARDAARRGFRVALVEQHDFASGSSSRTSKLVHGGVRYLEQGALRLVWESSRERRRLLQLAPHLVHPLPFVFPVFHDSRFGPARLRAGMLLYDLLAAFRNVHPHRMLAPAQAADWGDGLRRDGIARRRAVLGCGDGRRAIGARERAGCTRRGGASLQPHGARTAVDGRRPRDRRAGARLGERRRGGVDRAHGRAMRGGVDQWTAGGATRRQARRGAHPRHAYRGAAVRDPSLHAGRKPRWAGVLRAALGRRHAHRHHRHRRHRRPGSRGADRPCCRATGSVQVLLGFEDVHYGRPDVSQLGAAVERDREPELDRGRRRGHLATTRTLLQQILDTRRTGKRGIRSDASFRRFKTFVPEDAAAVFYADQRRLHHVAAQLDKSSSLWGPQVSEGIDFVQRLSGVLEHFPAGAAYVTHDDDSVTLRGWMAEAK